MVLAHTAEEEDLEFARVNVFRSSDHDPEVTCHFAKWPFVTTLYKLTPTYMYKMSWQNQDFQIGDGGNGGGGGGREQKMNMSHC